MCLLASQSAPDRHSKMASLRLFFDSMSQPARSVLLLLKHNNVPFKPELINLGKGEHLTNEEFATVAPPKIVPAMCDGDFKLFESEAMMKYICSKYDLPDHWYPKDIQQRAKTDEYLAWHHANLRMGVVDIVWGKMFRPHLLGQPVNEKMIERGQKKLSKCVHLFDNHFLKSTPFISNEQISIADLMALCEFSQLDLVPKDFVHLSPQVESWRGRCKEFLGANYDDVHSILYRLRRKFHPDANL